MEVQFCGRECSIRKREEEEEVWNYDKTKRGAKKRRDMNEGSKGHDEDEEEEGEKEQEEERE